jgi:3-hydroxyisobutyrate dehydrogenase-like beta-hydroxyacid dehydrogenase
MSAIQTLGFIGLGVMGEPMCANLLRKSGLPVTVFDQSPDPVNRLVTQGAKKAQSIADVAAHADVIFLSLPSIVQVETVATAIMQSPKKPRMIVDMSTSDVAGTRALAEKVKAAGMEYVDAPVARTKEAAVQGTLFITVGATPSQFQELQPLLSHMGSDVLHCGGTGGGQIVKILNNITVLMTVNALSEVLTIGRKAGMDSKELFDALSRGSADSFVLRNHGMKYMVPDNFPEKVFPVDYALKDASLALALAEQVGVDPHIAKHTHALLGKTKAAGFSQNYHPVMIKLVDGRVKS